MRELENNLYTLNHEEKSQAVHTGRLDCPECKKGMMLLNQGAAEMKAEFYCPRPCNISVLLFNR